MTARAHAAEKVSEWILLKKSIDKLPNEQKLKLIRNILGNIKDNNHRVVIASLASLETLLEYAADPLTPYLNIAFDHTLIKIGDAKINVRTKAFDVMVKILARFGLSAGVEKLFVSYFFCYITYF